MAASDLPELAGFRSDAWFLPDDDLLGFVEAPAGAFRMGSDPEADSMAFDNERWSGADPQRTVEVEAFYIGRYGHGARRKLRLRGVPLRALRHERQRLGADEESLSALRV